MQSLYILRDFFPKSFVRNLYFAAPYIWKGDLRSYGFLVVEILAGILMHHKEEGSSFFRPTFNTSGK
jgi:hypothetical protein